MSSPHWIELKRTDFLSAITSIKPTLRVKSAPERELQIGLVNGQVVFSIQGASSSKPAKGDWPGLACTRLEYFLTFLIAKPPESQVRITFSDGKIQLGTSRFPAEWVDSNDLFTESQLHQHAVMPAKENILKFKCPKCRRKQGVAFASLSPGPFVTDEIRALLSAGASLGHAFGCLSCGNSWEEQAV